MSEREEMKVEELEEEEVQEERDSDEEAAAQFMRTYGEMKSTELNPGRWIRNLKIALFQRLY